MTNAIVCIMSPDLAYKLGAHPAPREPTFGYAMVRPSTQIMVWATDGSQWVWDMVQGCRTI